MNAYIQNLKHQKRYWLLPVLALAWNQSVYYGARLINKNRFHHELTSMIDEKIPVWTWMVSVYFICFLVWALTYLYMASRDEKTAYRFFVADFLGKLTALVIFLCIPTTNVRPVLEGNSIWDALMRWLYAIDEADNLFPSIHCMVSWYCFIGIRRIKDCPLWSKVGMLIFALAVCISTVTTKQHVLIDVAGGVMIAEAAYAAAGWIVPKLRKVN